MAKHRSDPALVQAALAGSASAWDELITRYGRLVYSVPRRYGFDEADAEDVMQNVFVILLRKLHQLTDQTRLSSWLLTAAHRECWRLGKRKPANVELDESEIVPGSPPESLLEHWEQQHMVRSALEQLDGLCRTLLEALFTQPTEASYEQIAEQLGMKVGSIGPTRGRCFRKFQAILAEMGYEPDPVTPGD